MKNSPLGPLRGAESYPPSETAQRKGVVRRRIEIIEENKMNLGTQIDRLIKARERLRAKRAEVELLETKFREMEDQVLWSMGDVKLEKATGQLGTASISKTVVATVKAWDEVEQYIYANNALDLLQRRMSDKAWRERYEDGLLIPGTEPHTVVRLNLRIK
jgi:hypothetical protein